MPLAEGEARDPHAPARLLYLGEGPESVIILDRNESR